ncbi:hypothetical protein AB6A40_004068 [Gnathostoma spinigerum]|uniref:Uncharacterized protein n=1 Tax=Gnathostoma spinigerum TaxID=75299 RepID=A0ABD6EJ33_9BILA
MSISFVYLAFFIGLVSSTCPENDQPTRPPRPAPEPFNDGEVVDCKFIESRSGFTLNETAWQLFNGSLKMQPLCNPAMLGLRLYYKDFASVNNFPSPFSSSLTEDPTTGMEFHVLFKNAVNKTTITFMSFDETRANFTDIPLIVTLYPHEKRLRFNTRKDGEWCIPQEVSYTFPDPYWVKLQLDKCEGKQCFKVHLGEKRDNMNLVYTAYTRTLLKKYDFWSVKTYRPSVMEAAFWRNWSSDRSSITILRDGLSEGQPIMVRGRITDPEIKVKFSFNDGNYKEVTVKTNESCEVETLLFEVSDEGVLQSFKTTGEKTSYPEVDVRGATKFEVLSGMKVRAIEVEQCAGQFKEN